MSDQLHLPRIVCIECPAVVTIHWIEKYQQQNWEIRREIWVECHGQHMFGYYRMPMKPTEPPLKLLMSDVVTYTDTAIHEMFETQEREMQRAGERAKFLQHVMAKAPPVKP